MQLINGETIEEMKKLPDESIDMILADLPYGTTANKWDTVILFNELWEQYKRIIKDRGAIVLFGSEPFSSKLRLSNLKWYRYDWIWIKEQGTGHLNAKKMPMRAHEVISVFYKKLPTYNPQLTKGTAYKTTSGNSSSNYNKQHSVITKNNGSRYPLTYLKYQRDKSRLHPTQKPVDLLEYLIKTYTQSGEVVLDNTMGSGSTGVACLNTNRDFIGIELDKHYFEIAKSRIYNNN